jgi:hypothetical protein
MRHSRKRWEAEAGAGIFAMPCLIHLYEYNMTAGHNITENISVNSSCRLTTTENTFLLFRGHSCPVKWYESETLMLYYSRIAMYNIMEEVTSRLQMFSLCHGLFMTCRKSAQQDSSPHHSSGSLLGVTGGLFHSALSIRTAQNRMIRCLMNGELERIWKEAIVA